MSGTGVRCPGADQTAMLFCFQLTTEQGSDNWTRSELHESKDNQSCSDYHPEQKVMMMVGDIIMIGYQSKHRDHCYANRGTNSCGQVNCCKMNRVSNQGVTHERTCAQGQVYQCIEYSQIEVCDVKLSLDVNFVEGVAHSQSVQGGVGQKR